MPTNSFNIAIVTDTTMNSLFTFKSNSLDDHHDVKLNTVHFTDVSDYAIEENTVDDECKSLSSSSSSNQLLSGWGSAESRKSYACLTSLVVGEDNVASPRRIVSSVPNVEGKGWGYFVDTRVIFKTTIP